MLVARIVHLRLRQGLPFVEKLMNDNHGHPQNKREVVRYSLFVVR